MSKILKKVDAGNERTKWTWELKQRQYE